MCKFLDMFAKLRVENCIYSYGFARVFIDNTQLVTYFSDASVLYVILLGVFF